MNKSEIPTGQKSVLSMLIDDHRKVEKLAKEYKKEKDDTRKKAIVDEACIELMAHTQIEEEIFYPFLRDKDPKEFGSMLDEALVEHASVKSLLKQLQQMQPGDDLYDAKFTVVGEYVNHHVKEEEDEMFKQVIEKKIDLRELEEKMKTMKEEIVAKASAK